MSGKQQQHATFTVTRTYEAPLERVFAEFVDPVSRARWSAPPGDVLIYEETSFRPGGRDVFRCGPPEDARFRGVTSYHLVVPNERVVSTETLDENGRLLGVSLNTLEFETTDHGTRVSLTVQMVSFAGAGLIQGYEFGNRSALENLASELKA